MKNCYYGKAFLIIYDESLSLSQTLAEIKAIPAYLKILHIQLPCYMEKKIQLFTIEDGQLVSIKRFKYHPPHPTHLKYRKL